MEDFIFTPIIEKQTNRPEKAGFSFTPITEPEENDFSAAKPHQIFSVDGSNTNAPARLGVAAKSFHKNKKLHATAVFGESISQSVVRGLLDTAGGVGSFINWYGDNMILPDDFFGLDKKTIDRLNTFGRGWQKAGSILRKGADFVLKGDALKLDEETFSGDFVDNPSFTRTAAAFASAAPSLMSMAGLFKLTGSAGLAYFVMGGVDSADVYEAAKEKGVDLGKTNFLYGTSMAGTALIDRFLSPVENILGKKLIGKSLGKKIADRLVGGMLEATGEGAQTLVQNAVEKYGIDDTKNLFEGVIESMIGGFGSGAFATGAFDRANKNLLDKGATQEEINALVDAAGMYAQKNPDAINDIAFQQLNQGLSNFEKFISEHEGTPEAAAALQKKTELETVGQRIFDRLIDAGQPENVAKAQSRVVQGIALWGSEETGLSPLEYFDQRFPSVQREKFKDFRERIAKAKDGNVDLFELLVNPREYRRLEKAERGKKGASLLSFLRKNVGLKDDGGELKAMDAGKLYVGLVNNKTGRTLDDMALEAWEAGYFPEFNERPAVDDLIEAIRNELSGNKRYAFQSENDRSLVADVDSIAEQMDQLGIDYSKMSAREAEKAYNEAVAAYNEETASPVAEDGFFTEDKTAAVPQETFDEDIPFQMDENGLNENDVAKSVKKFNEDLPSVIQSAKEAKGKGTTENKEASFLISQHISQVLKKYGINTFGFTADLNTSFVNHAIIEHGNPSVEEKQGQIAVNYDDFSKIPNVINNPDYIVIERYKDSSIGLVFVKNMEENTPFVVELRSRKKKRLLAKTMYKKRRAIHASELRSLNLTSKNVPVDKIIIDVKTEDVNMPFYQSASAPRGAYYDNVIRLFERANASTFMHETAHWFKAELQSFNSEKSRALLDKVNKWESEEYARRYKTELKDGRYIVRDTLGNVVYDQNFQTEEKAKDYAKNELFARGFEAYLKEGKSPNNYMKQAFKSFWNWLRHLYRSAKSLNVELNDDIRSVYSDIIGGEDIDFYLNAPASEVIGARQKMQKEKETELDGMIERAVEDSKNRSAFDSFFAEKTASNKDRAKWWAKAIVPISTRANRISPRLKNRMRSYEYTLNQKLNEKMTQIKPFLDKWATFSNDDIVAFDLSVKNGYEARRDTILEKYNAIEEFKAVKVLLESIYNEASSVKVEMRYKEDYFPRQVEDVDGLMTYLHGLDMASELRRAEHDAGFEDMTPEEQAGFLNKFLRGFNRKDTTAALPGNVKKRTIIEITPEINVYYKPSIQALTNYIERMNASIESRKFWGFDMDNIDDSIGAFVDELIQNEEIRPDQDKEVEEILRARFKAKGVSNKYLLWQKNASYVYTMGGINSAITQIDDISVALYKAGFWNTVNSIFRDNRPGLSREELGLQKIGQEFMEASTMSKAVDKVFKMTGLDAIDGFGKNVLINATFNKFQNMAENNEAKLRERIEPILENETDETIEDIKAGNISENVKLLMFNELADMQPIALSEMPEYYLTSGNGRVLYMLKTFMLKRIDIFRNECFDKIKSGNTKEGVQNLFRLAALMIFCGTTKDAIIDMLFGRKFHLDDMIVNNVLGLFGLTKYQLYKARDEGFEGFASSFIPPLFAMWADLGRDVSKKLFSKNGKDLKDFEIWKGVPLVGRFYYWWFGGGRAKEDKKNKKARLK